MIITAIKRIEEEAIDSLRVRCRSHIQEDDRINAEDIAAKTLNDLGLHDFAREFRKIVNESKR